MRFGSLPGPAILLFSTLLPAACDSPGAPPGEVVQVPRPARPLVEAILSDASAAAWYGLRFSDALTPPHLGFSGWLVGRTERYAAHVSLASADAGEYDEFCLSRGPGPNDPGFWQEHDACSRLRIDEEGIHVDLYFTERPHHLPEDRHELRYPTESGPEGTVVYGVNPLVTWHYGFGEDGSHEIEAAVDTRVRVESTTGEEFVLDHVGTVHGASNASGTAETTRVELEFPELTSCSPSLRAVVDDDGETVTGAVTCGDRVVAEIRHPGDDLHFEWIEP